LFAHSVHHPQRQYSFIHKAIYQHLNQNLDNLTADFILIHQCDSEIVAESGGVTPAGEQVSAPKRGWWCVFQRGLRHLDIGWNTVALASQRPMQAAVAR
jgi:hypothetical protein